MAGNWTYFASVHGRQMEYYEGSITFGATGAVASHEDGGSGATVTRTATGRYDITLPRNYPRLVATHFSPDDRFGQDDAVSLDVANSDITTAVVAFSVRDLVGPSDIDPPNPSRVDYSICVKAANVG